MCLGNQGLIFFTVLVHNLSRLFVSIGDFFTAGGDERIALMQVINFRLFHLRLQFYATLYRHLLFANLRGVSEFGRSQLLFQSLHFGRR